MRLCVEARDQFFHDNENRAFVLVREGGVARTQLVRSREYGLLLGRRFYQATGSGLPSTAKTEAIATFEGLAVYEGREEAVFIRIGEYKGSVVLDLCDKPVSVEKDNCGWDITSLEDGQVARYIEVKGRAGDGDVALTENEWIKAQRFGEDYWLYIVTDCKSEPKLHMIQDPASKLRPKEEVKIVRYMVNQTDWRGAARSS